MKPIQGINQNNFPDFLKKSLLLAKITNPAHIDRNQSLMWYQNNTDTISHLMIQITY